MLNSAFKKYIDRKRNFCFDLKSLYHLYIFNGKCFQGITLICFCAFLSCSKPYLEHPPANTKIKSYSLIQVVEPSGSSMVGYYIALPIDYDHNDGRYPLLITLHGSGQFGSDSADLPMILNEGIPELLNNNLFPGNFKVREGTYSFVIVMPQFKWQPSPKQVDLFVKQVCGSYRIDASRVYLSGFSAGGTLTCDVAAAFPKRFAAIVAISGVSMQGLQNKCKHLADENLPIWVFHNDQDQYSPISRTKLFISTLNNFKPTLPPKFTVFPSWGLYGHDAWTKATDPEYREGGLNIYEWMLQYKR